MVLALLTLGGATGCSSVDAGRVLALVAPSLGNAYQTDSPPGTPGYARRSGFATEGDMRSRRQSTTLDGR